MAQSNPLTELENDFDAMLESTEKPKKTKTAKKSTKEIESVPNNIQTKISDLLKAKKAKKIAESDMKKAETEILDYGLRLKDDKGFSGQFQKSYKLGNNDEHITFVNANKWSFNPDDVSEIAGILGNESNEMLVKNRTVKLKSEVFSDPELKQALIDAVGNRFSEFFETEVSYSVSEDFDKKVYDVCDEESLEDLRIYMKQSKPSLR